ELVGKDAQSFKYKYNQSSLLSTWSNTNTKTRELNRIYPKEYDGTIFAGRQENTWVTYDPLKVKASGKIPFQYNTCESLELEYETFTTGVWKEYADHLTCYLTNYDVSERSVKSVIKINGATAQPSYTLTTRESTTAKATEEWKDGVYTLTVTHNGPLDLAINCSGSATDRKTEYTAAQVIVPQAPKLYHGPLQHEAEVFDYKNISYAVGSGYSHPIRNYTGQGYVNFGKSKNAALRDDFSLLEEGRYSIKIRYRAATADINHVDLYLNGEKIGTPDFIQSGSDNGVWYTTSMAAYFNEGKNIIELKANAMGSADLYIDNIIIEPIP
ncbi:MAG: glycosyl hydrolase family 98, partial [Duncaniella sp.]|nr:glycosyl hydrolase family 98 [Duncaniella sp.]